MTSAGLLIIVDFISSTNMAKLFTGLMSLLGLFSEANMHQALAYLFSSVSPCVRLCLLTAKAARTKYHPGTGTAVAIATTITKGSLTHNGFTSFDVRH